ncbi:hypothetical protein EKO04_000857 [Ascochyta lentis]|uniref:chitin synthase n=1 Tax=Ascochyta lentis TaxID=205686 RepID=A0A8H7MLQ3_9PLEO|nr:hypothetical protein EKO04_000857 [Ascochyta lentis]
MLASELAMGTPKSLPITSLESVHIKRRTRKLSLSLRSSKENANEHRPPVNSRKHRREKYAFLSILFLANLAVSLMSMNFSRFYWILLPITLFRPFVDSTEITLLVIFYLIRRLYPTPPKVPDTPENLAYLLTCYNETSTELTRSLASLADQQNLETHNKAVIIVCDGRCNGRGMEKTTADQLKEDVIENATTTSIPSAYTAWDGKPMDVELIRGTFKSLDVLCIVKEENRGKRDSLILIRSFLHKLNQQATNPHQPIGIFSPQLFTHMRHFFQSLSMPTVQHIIGIDADTRFDPHCITNLVQTARESPKIVGVSGFVLADPTITSPFSLPFIYQTTEYRTGQIRRRFRQSLMTRKVTCLPGCCQLLRVVEETCGDELLSRFGYYPLESDTLFRTIQSMTSEDRDHICLMLQMHKDVQTRQCLAARAYTSVPHSAVVFLRQRRRWTLGPIVSDSLLALRGETGVAERMAAVASVWNWASTLSMLFAPFFRAPLDPTTARLCSSLIAYRNTWDYTTVLLSSTSLLQLCQNIVGCILVSQLAPTAGVIVHIYSLMYLDDFQWGKMRGDVKGV